MKTLPVMRVLGFTMGAAIGAVLAAVALLALWAQSAPQPADAASPAPAVAPPIPMAAFEALEARLLASEAHVRDLTAERDILRDIVSDGGVRPRELVVEKVNVAYDLVPPKLMLGVRALSGGALKVHFGDRTERIEVGQLIDFVYGHCTCSLALRESVRGKARFVFGCERNDSGEGAAASAAGAPDRAG
jgi:hypothetical protein